MGKISETKIAITPETVLLDIMSRWPATESVFRRYDKQAGVCICCTCLFDTIEDVASRFSLDKVGLIQEIIKAADDTKVVQNNRVVSDRK